MKCTFKKPDGSVCNAKAMHNSNYCVFHNPDISDEERFSIRSEAHKPAKPEFIEIPLPEMKMDNLRDVANVLADSINQVRARKISQKSGTSIAYMTFVLYMIMKEAKAEENNDEIAKQKANGTYRPEPDYGQKHYTYKDHFYLDKDGNELIIENDGTNIWNPKHFRIESECEPFIPPDKRNKKKRKTNNVITPEKAPVVVIPPLDNVMFGGVNDKMSVHIKLPEEMTDGEKTTEVLKAAKSIGILDTS
jgi:hypothetical protein